MITLRFTYQTRIDFSKDIADHAFLLRCFPIEAKEQQIKELVHTSFPVITGGQYSFDGFGNRVYTGRIDRSHREFEYKVSGIVVRNDSLKSYEEAMPCYKYSSELIRMDDDMEFFYHTLNLKGTNLEKARVIARAVARHMNYAPGSTGVATTAAEAFRNKSGVCQDFAHVMIALCRSALIPARYVCGLPFGEGQTHAWVEIWDEGYWHGLDPTRECNADEGYIKLCVGRDYSDCPIERGVFKGDALQSQEIFMKVSYEEEAALPA